MGIVGGLPSPPPKWSSEIFLVASIISDKITVQHDIWENSEFVILNGLTLTNDISCDYIINGSREIEFLSDVLTTDGHVLVKYTYQ